MRRRRLLATAAAAGLTATGLSFCGSAGPEDRIGRDGYAAVRLGMTEAEVAEVTGRPHGNYLRCEWAVPHDALRESEGPLAEAERSPPGRYAGRSWAGEGGHADVAMDREGRVGCAPVR